MARAEDFAALLHDLYSGPEAPGVNPVQVMTIHRAKGLEFDHVFVPGLDRGVGAGERPLLRWIDLRASGTTVISSWRPLRPSGRRAGAS